MNQNYKIKLNSSQPSSKDIARHQNFDALLDNYQAAAQPKPRPRLRRLVYIGSAAAAAALLLLFVFLIDNSPNLSAEEYFAQQEFVHPPMEDIKAQFASQRTDINQGGIFEYASGSRLLVPAGAFLDQAGQPVSGEVDIHMKEFHDYVDFFLSGIPMVYDSAGTRYNLESAGMIEIYAEQNGQRLQLAPGKAIEVELVSEVILPNVNVSPRYNIYKLDTAQRNWVYQDIDKIQLLEDEVLDSSDPLYPMKKELIENINAIEARAATDLTAIESSVIEPDAPVKPQPANGDNPSLELDFLQDNIIVDGDGEADFQRKYEGAIWQISPKSGPYDERAFNVTWENMKLRQLNGVDFELLLINPSNELRLVVNPVLSGADYEAALAEYQKEFAIYEQKMAEREAQLVEEKLALEQRVEDEKIAAQKAFDDRLKALRDQGLAYAASQEIIKRKVINRFKATSFGIWNCDRPIPPDEYQIQARFVDQNGTRYNNHTAFLVDKSRNTVCRFYASKGANMNFNAKSENLMWIMTEEGKIAVFPPENFKKINQQKGDYTFNMTLVDREVKTESDVREILQF